MHPVYTGGNLEKIESRQCFEFGLVEHLNKRTTNFWKGEKIRETEILASSLGKAKIQGEYNGI